MPRMAPDPRQKRDRSFCVALIGKGDDVQGLKDAALQGQKKCERVTAPLSP